MIDKYNYLINSKVGKLTILSLEKKEKKSYIHVNYVCDCGKIGSTRVYNILNKPNISCGCNMSLSKIKYDYNENIFKTLNTKSAYTLGLLYSDGCLVKNKNEVKLALVNDFEILEKLSMFILNSIKIKTSYNSYNNVVYNFNFCNSTIYKDLLNWGLYPAKSKTLKIHPDLKFNPHFWRGVIDGDGSINYKVDPKNEKYSYSSVEVCGTIDVCQSFKDFCSSIINVENIKINKSKRIDNFGIFRVCGKRIIPILNKIYEEHEEFFMTRKREKFDEYLQHLTKNKK